MMLLGGSGTKNSAFSSGGKSKIYSGPKRTFSIVRNRDKKNSIVLIDKKQDFETQSPKGYLDTGNEKGPFGNYVVDSITYGSPPPVAPTSANPVEDTSLTSLTGATLVNNAPANSITLDNDILMSGGIGATKRGLELDDTAWDELEINTDKFLPAVVPQWTTNSLNKDKALPPRPSRTTAKARIKRTGKGWFMRLVHQVKPGHAEVAYIHMRENVEETRTATALNSIDLKPHTAGDIQEEVADPALNSIEGPLFCQELPGSSLYPQELDTTPAPSTSRVLAPANRSGDNTSSSQTGTFQPEHETLPNSSTLLQKSLNQGALQSTNIRVKTYSPERRKTSHPESSTGHVRGDIEPVSHQLPVRYSCTCSRPMTWSDTCRIHYVPRSEGVERTDPTENSVSEEEPAVAIQPLSHWSSDSESENGTPEASGEAFRNTSVEPCSRVSPATTRSSRGSMQNMETASSLMQHRRAFSFCNSESSSILGTTPEQQEMITKSPARGRSKHPRSKIQKSTAKGKERAKPTDIGFQIPEVQTPVIPCSVSQPDQTPKAWSDFDGGGEEDPIRLIKSYFRWRDDHAVMVHDEHSNGSAHTEPDFRESIYGSLPELAAASSDTTYEHNLPSNSPVLSLLNKSMSAEGFREATGSTESQVEACQLTDLETRSTVITPPGDITTHPRARERLIRSQLTIFASLMARSILDRVVQCLKLIVETQLMTPAIPREHVRIRWTCKCGKELFDDFIEKRTGAARQLEQYLNRPRQHAGDGGGSSSASGPSSHPSQSSLSGQSTAATAATSLDTADISTIRSLSNQDPWTPSLGIRRSPTVIEAPRFSQPLWLLACAERQKFTTKLVHLDVDAGKIRSDMELANLIKEQYTKLRPSWQHILRLRGLITIQFVQFELHRTQVVDIRKCPDIPAKTNDEYSFLPSDLIPPVGERYLMHLFHHPEDYEDELITYERLPKKRGMKLRVGQRADVGVGWGIHLVEDFLAYKIWSFFTSFFVLVSLIFGIVWAARKGDVQGAFGVAAYVSALSTMIIGCCIAYLE